MGELTLMKSQLSEGVWQGVLVGAEGHDAPQIVVTHQLLELSGVELIEQPDAGHWQVQVPIPAELISDGVQSFVISTRDSSEVLGRLVLSAGTVLDHDLCAEVALLREELDLLKRAFRRHCQDRA